MDGARFARVAFEPGLSRPSGATRVERTHRVGGRPVGPRQARANGRIGDEPTPDVRVLDADVTSPSTFRSVVDSVPLALCGFDQEGLVRLWNPACEALFGWSEAEVLGYEAKFIPDDRIDEFIDIGARVSSGEVVRGVETQRLRKDGTLVDVSISVAPIFGEDETVVGTIGVLADITARKQAEEAFRSSENRIQALLWHSSDFVIVWNTEGTITYASPSVTRFTGYRVGESIHHDARLVHPDDEARVVQALEEVRAGVTGTSGSFEARFRRHDGEWRWVEAIVGNLIDDPDIGGLLVNARDVTERREAEVRVQQSEDDLRSVLEASPDLIARFDKDLRHVYVNPAVELVTGFKREDLLGRTMGDLNMTAEFCDVWDTNLRRAFETASADEFEYQFGTPAGPRWFHTRIAPEFDGDRSVGRVLVVSRDVTERRAAEEELTYKTLHDPLTGLPNRVLLLDRVGLALDRLERTGGLVAVLFLDLDRFKVVNDSLGHAAGDWLLVEVGKRLVDASRPGDTVARLGGDEFVVVCGELGSARDAAAVATRFAVALATPFDHPTRSISVTVSIGIATSCESARDPGELFGDADAAMYRAKHNGRARYEFYEPESRDQAVRSGP
jgi:diguanylate cyclase (GGDEF)-like protein/PAS domain S-box-containing protein